MSISVCRISAIEEFPFINCTILLDIHRIYYGCTYTHYSYTHGNNVVESAYIVDYLYNTIQNIMCFMVVYHHHLRFTHLTVYYFYCVILRHINNKKNTQISERKELNSGVKTIMYEG